MGYLGDEAWEHTLLTEHDHAWSNDVDIWNEMVFMLRLWSLPPAIAFLFARRQRDENRGTAVSSRNQSTPYIPRDALAHRRSEANFLLRNSARSLHTIQT